MFKLYVPITLKLINHYSFPSFDLPDGLRRYSNIAEKYNIEIISEFNKDIDGVFSMWELVSKIMILKLIIL